MIPQRRKILIQSIKLFDLLSMVFCFFGAALVQSNIEHYTFGHFLSMRIKVQNVLLFSGFVFVWHSILASSGLYTSKRISSRWTEIVDIIKSTSIGTFALFILAMLFNIRMISNSFLAIFWAAISLSTILSRLMLKFVLKQLRLNERNLRDIVVVGTNPRAIQFAEKLAKRKEFGYRIIGFVDNNWSNLHKFPQKGHTIVSDLREFPSFLRNNVVDEVMVCLPLKSFYQEISNIVATCEEQGITVRFLSDFFNLKMARTKEIHFEGESVILYYSGSMVGYSVLIKRIIDIILSIVFIIIFSPILLLSVLLIKLTSPGPVLYVQERLGLNKRKIRVFKFRTMIIDADKKQAEMEHLNEVSGPVFKIKNDPRITPIGNILRKTSVDELPQLFNVLKGDMSLVGPRPLPVRDFLGFSEDWHRRRFSVKPGITCLWQINGRSDISFEKWMELDMHYIDNWSLWLDLKILLGTIPAVLKGSGAA